jgi:CubicO group peptidase (beta-lactamase class C family)
VKPYAFFLMVFPLTLPAQIPDHPELIRQIANLGDSLSAAGQFSGVILLAKNGVPVFSRAYGYADRDQKAPNTIETKFNIGSINKTFTRLAILMLADQGKLSLDDRVERFLPDYPNKEAAAKVTIRQLLQMTSGIGDIFGERYDKTPKERLLSLKDYLPLFADKHLEFEPGQGRRYSNGGYIVLGLIIESVTGMNYYGYVKANIFKPAGMENSDWYPKDAVVANLATGYVADGGRVESNFSTLPGKGSSAGGGFSTAGDLLRYAIALEKGTIGARGYDIEGGLGIAGGAPGINAVMEWMRRSGYVAIVLSNYSPPSAERIARQVRAWLNPS